MGAGYETVQDRTRLTADQLGERWSVEDLDLVVAFTDDVRDEDLAVSTGRTLASIWSIQHRLRHEGVEGVRASIVAEAKRRVASREVGYDWVTTFPPGHFD